MTAQQLTLSGPFDSVSPGVGTLGVINLSINPIVPVTVTVRFAKEGGTESIVLGNNGDKMSCQLSDVASFTIEAPEYPVNVGFVMTSAPNLTVSFAAAQTIIQTEVGSFVQAAQHDDTAGIGGSETVTLNTPAKSGDVLLLIVSTSVVTLPAGFTLVGTAPTTQSTVAVTTYAKIASGGETAITVGVTNTPGGPCTVAVLEFSAATNPTINDGVSGASPTISLLTSKIPWLFILIDMAYVAGAIPPLPAAPAAFVPVATHTPSAVSVPRITVWTAGQNTYQTVSATITDADAVSTQAIVG